MSEADPSTRDYRDTVFLPKTDFPMKAGLPQKEPGILARWQDENLTTSCARRGGARKNSSCMTARPTPMATCISATR